MSYQTTAFTDPQKQAFVISKVNASAQPGKSTLSNPDGTVLSMQPDGSWETRPAGADGLYERCSVDGQTATYWYEFGGALVGPVTVAFFKASGPAQ